MHVLQCLFLTCTKYIKIQQTCCIVFIVVMLHIQLHPFLQLKMSVNKSSIVRSNYLDQNFLDVNFALTVRVRTGEEAQGIKSQFKFWRRSD